MKIKYLKKAPRGMPGDVVEVPDMQAKVLIRLKIAQPFQFLENLNGTPVVDDYGSLVELSQFVERPVENIQTSIQEKEQLKSKQKRVSKAK